MPEATADAPVSGQRPQPGKKGFVCAAGIRTANLGFIAPHSLWGARTRIRQMHDTKEAHANAQCSKKVAKTKNSLSPKASAGGSVSQGNEAVKGLLQGSVKQRNGQLCLGRGPRLSTASAASLLASCSSWGLLIRMECLSGRCRKSPRVYPGRMCYAKNRQTACLCIVCTVPCRGLWR